MDVARRVVAVLAAQPDLSGVTSIATLADLAAAAQVPLDELLVMTPAVLRDRLLDPAGNRLAVWGRMPDLQSADLAGRLAALDGELDAVRAASPGYAIGIEGLSALTAGESGRMIGELRISLLAAFVLALGLIAVAVRDRSASFAAVLPNLLPLVAVGALLHLGGRNLEFASAVSLTLAIGIAVDNTIHVLRRWDLAYRPGLSARTRVMRAYARVGPVIVLATAVLIVGFAQTLASPLPMTRLFGLVAIVMLALALAANLTYLPACLMIADRARRK
jgi:uncharacterized membrane protein YdfJ with MMPL/SSD domain